MATASALLLRVRRMEKERRLLAHGRNKRPLVSSPVVAEEEAREQDLRA